MLYFLTEMPYKARFLNENARFCFSEAAFFVSVFVRVSLAIISDRTAEEKFGCNAAFNRFLKILQPQMIFALVVLVVIFHLSLFLHFLIHITFLYWVAFVHRNWLLLSSYHYYY